MICLLCLEDWDNPKEFIKISTQIDNPIFDVISKHFWFKPQELTDAKCLCNTCWYQVDLFHSFYVKIEETHLNYGITPPVKTEPTDSDDVKENIFLDMETVEVPQPKRRRGRSSSSKTNSIATTSSGRAKTVKKESKKTPVPKKPITKKKTVKETFDDEYDDFKDEDLKHDDDFANDDFDFDELQDESGDDDNDDDFEKPKEKGKRTRNRGLRVDEADEKISNYLTLKCDICSHTCQTLALLKAHFRDTHSKKGYATCCGKKFYKRYLLVDHIEVHLNPEYFKCTYCQKIFSVADCLKKHVKDAHESEKIEYFCDQCPKKFIRQMLLDRHKAYHRPIEEWTDSCTFENCTKIFPSKFYLRSHIIFTHNKLPTKVCHICGQSMPSNKYKKHVLEHEGISAPKVQCDICGAWLIKKYLATHKINHEEATMNHTCPKCGKISPNKRALYIHMRYTHAEVRRFECSFCQKTFKRRLALRQHMGIHTGENLYKCPYCPKTFTYDSNFHNHKKKDHPLEHAEEKKRKPRTDFVKCVEQQEHQEQQQQQQQDHQQNHQEQQLIQSIQPQVDNLSGQIGSFVIKFELDNRNE